MGSRGIPGDKINLRLILVSGKSKEFLFTPNESAADITELVYNNWPTDWEDEPLPPANILRLIYQGRFLHGNVTLGALQLPMGKTTVMHLVPRENLPEPNNQGQLKKDKSGESNCSNCCVIL
ncbi:ubiquitin-like protein 3 [Mizuhopecten yessoensis]|uniref:Ubiquitin-like protein 3 n=1 Tax=Mizuhopecten yessoensis TaxID=6573 RepID=A0A210QVV0_MIZYE|nr:ubiquitin-like protein 3 [Mizuhopecten yessoensis]XP_033742469.1 ubiquitin-like protein 3 [Pecten maximus]OWF52880.1 Ubiquitin-like protein 3 [Mizuhopecten yessoensis]